MIGEEEIEETRYAGSDVFLIQTNDDIKTTITNLIGEFYKALENYDSGTRFKSIENFRFNIARQKRKIFFQRNAGSYIPLDEKVANSKSCVNIKNLDDKCIEYCIISFLFYEELKKTKKLNEPRIYKKYIDQIKRPDGITYPINLESDVEPYETLNDLCINIYQIHENNSFTHLRKSKFNDKPENRHLNLLIIIDEQNNNSHLVWIRDFSRFSNHFMNNKKNKNYVCENCLTEKFPSKEKCAEHYKRCIANIKTKIVLPKEGSTMKFEHANREFSHPFFCCADFESTLQTIKEDDPINKTNDDDVKMIKYQKHVPNSYGIKFNCIHDEFSEDVKINVNSNQQELLKQFVEDLEEYARKSYQLLYKNYHFNHFNFRDKHPDLFKKHEDETKCNRCQCEFTDTNIKVAHHDHINGNFISTLCSVCNKAYKYNKFLPVYLHNLKGYDSHLFITALYKYGYVDKTKENIISCIPNTEQQYISFSKHIVVGTYHDKNNEIQNKTMEIRFIDSFAFLSSSIEKITDSLKDGLTNIDDLRKVFKYSSQHFKDDEQFKIMISKGIYPYDFIDSFDKLNTVGLPSKDSFYSRLTDSKINDKDYKTAQQNYEILKCKSFMDYHKYYLTSDVLLLTDIWYNFKNLCMDIYKLDPIYYYTAPSLSWDAFLKLSKVELELLTNLEMFEFVESSIRGGLSQISTRYAQANNPKVKNEKYKYDSSKESSQIIYLDANNLYGWSMIQHLPYKSFQWNNDVWTKEKILEIDDKANKGYLFEVDLSIHNDLHDFFNNYTPLPVNKSVVIADVNDKNLPKYKETKITKLCCDLHDRVKYRVHYRMLKLALSLGFKLEKVHRVLEFEQKPFMAEYIMLNTNKRTLAKSDFEKDFYKLMNNSCFGKTMENVRNRIDFTLINSQKQLDKAKRLTKFTIFDEESDLVGLHHAKCSVTLNKPIYIGQCILDDSKYLMVDFHYNFMHKKVGIDNFNLLFTDTDSLCYHIRNKDFYEIMFDNKDKFDLSDFPKNDKLYDSTNKKVIGKFKVEYSGTELIEFVGLRSKVYSILKDDAEHEESKKLKGIKSYVVKNEIKHQDYLNTLTTGIDLHKWQNSIRCFKHQLYSVKQYKKALSRSDDKVYICDDNIHTLTHGHKDIPKPKK